MKSAKEYVQLSTLNLYSLPKYWNSEVQQTTRMRKARKEQNGYFEAVEAIIDDKVFGETTETKLFKNIRVTYLPGLRN